MVKATSVYFTKNRCSVYFHEIENFGQHDNTPHVEFPDHAPEIHDGRLAFHALGHHVGFRLVEALQVFILIGK